MSTVRESAIEDLERTKRIISSGITSDFYLKRLAKLEDMVAWYETDEARPCWEVINLFEIPVTYTEDGAWDDWLDDLDDDMRENIIVKTGTITGRECGDLELYED